MPSVEKIRELIDDRTLSDDEIARRYDDVYALAEIILDVVTRPVTPSSSESESADDVVPPRPAMKLVRVLDAVATPKRRRASSGRKIVTRARRVATRNRD